MLTKNKQWQHKSVWHMRRNTTVKCNYHQWPKDVCTLSNSNIYLIKKNTSLAYKNCDKSKFLSLLWRFGPYLGHSLPSFLPPILFCAADFQLHIWSRETVSFCTLSSNLLRGLPSYLFPPKLTPKIFFGMWQSSILITWPAHFSIYIWTYVERTLANRNPFFTQHIIIY
jgi:hypothetical protein